jgi:hypothetical protein
VFQVLNRVWLVVRKFSKPGRYASPAISARVAVEIAETLVDPERRVVIPVRVDRVGLVGLERMVNEGLNDDVDGFDRRVRRDGPGASGKG